MDRQREYNTVRLLAHREGKPCTAFACETRAVVEHDFGRRAAIASHKVVECLTLRDFQGRVQLINELWVTCLGSTLNHAIAVDCDVAVSSLQVMEQKRVTFLNDEARPQGFSSKEVLNGMEEGRDPDKNVLLWKLPNDDFRCRAFSCQNVSQDTE